MMPEKEKNPLLAERIRALRETLEMTREDLMLAIGGDYRQIWEYEKGTRTPNSVMLGKLADALNTSTDYLLGRTENPERPMRGENDLDEKEKKLLKSFRKKRPEAKEQIIQMVEIIG